MVTINSRWIKRDEDLQEGAERMVHWWHHCQAADCCCNPKQFVHKSPVKIYSKGILWHAEKPIWIVIISCSCWTSKETWQIEIKEWWRHARAHWQDYLTAWGTRFHWQAHFGWEPIQYHFHIITPQLQWNLNIYFYQYRAPLANNYLWWPNVDHPKWVRLSYAARW